MKTKLGKRTQFDFSKHELSIYHGEKITIHELKVPNTRIDYINFTNIDGMLIVSGDYSNWMFDREFTPTPENRVSDTYWIEKMRRSSCQNPYSYDSTATEKAINDMLTDESIADNGYTEEDVEWLTELLDYVYDEIEYKYNAFRTMPDGWDCEYVPYKEKVDYHLLVVFDAFEEICNRLNQNESE